MHHQEFKVASSPFYLVSLATIESAKEILLLRKADDYQKVRRDYKEIDHRRIL